jgi:hypothetical protein
MKKMNYKNVIIVGLYFGVFQALMPTIGYFLGKNFENLIKSIDHWIAFVLLYIIGINMIRECLKNESIYQIVEFDSGPLPVISSNNGNYISIKLGSENNLPIMKKCACITAYFESKNNTGAITIYGPLRMKYRHVISFLRCLVRNMK